MAKLPRITAEDLIRALGRDGWDVSRQAGSHKILRHATKPGHVAVPYHRGRVLKLKTLATILAKAGLTVDDLRSLL